MSFLRAVSSLEVLLLVKRKLNWAEDRATVGTERERRPSGRDEGRAAFSRASFFPTLAVRIGTKAINPACHAYAFCVFCPDGLSGCCCLTVRSTGPIAFVLFSAHAPQHIPSCSRPPCERPLCRPGGRRTRKFSCDRPTMMRRSNQPTSDQCNPRRKIFCRKRLFGGNWCGRVLCCSCPVKRRPALRGRNRSRDNRVRAGE